MTGEDMPKTIIILARGQEVGSQMLQPKYGKMFAKKDSLVNTK